MAITLKVCIKQVNYATFDINVQTGKMGRLFCIFVVCMFLATRTILSQ